MKKHPMDERYLVASYLWAQGVQNQEIARLLRVKAPAVTRMLQKAREAGLIRESRTFVADDLDESRLEEIEKTAFGALIRKPLLTWARRAFLPLEDIHVFYSGEQMGSEDTWWLRLRRFSQAAAPTVLELLSQSTACGLTWGTTLAAVVEAVTRLRRRSDEEWPVVFPTTGEPLGSNERPLSSSHIARELADFLNLSASSSFPSLVGIPAIIPRSFGAGEAFNAFREYIGETKSYRQIFGGPEEERDSTLVGRMDCLLTSLGRPHQLVIMHEAELIESAGFDRRQLERLVLTDLGGVLIRREDEELSGKDALLLDDFDRRWTGINKEHLQRCAEEAPEGSPGVVLMALSDKKADAVIRCIRNHWVRTLIVDHHLGAAIATKLKLTPEEPQRA